MPAATITFGNPYAIRYFCDAPTIIAAYEDDSLTHKAAAAAVLFGKLEPKGKLPVTVCNNFKFGTGITSLKTRGAPQPAGSGRSRVRRPE